jgi:hypothetical protein
MLTRTRNKLISAVAAFLAAIVLGGVATTIHRYMPEGLVGAAAGVFLTAVTILLVMIGFNVVCDWLELRTEGAASLVRLRDGESSRGYFFRERNAARLNGAAYVNGHAATAGDAYRRESSARPTIPITQRRQPVASELSEAKQWVGQ